MLVTRRRCFSFFFFFNDTATTEIYTLSLHDALPICFSLVYVQTSRPSPRFASCMESALWNVFEVRSEEHTSELQSPCNLVCRLLLEKKKMTAISPSTVNLKTFDNRLRTIFSNMSRST